MLFRSSEYYSRPDDPYEFYEDMIKQAVYFGGKVLPERKNYGIFKYFKERGYEKFLMARPIGIKNNQTTIKDNLAGLPAHANVTSAGFELIEAYLSQQYDEGVDYLKDFLFERTLEDILMFNPKDTHKYDLTMSLIYTMFAGNELKKQITFR